MTYAYIVTLVLGIVAVVHWRRNGQSVGRGLGFTLQPWALGDFLAGFAIAFIAMLGILLVEMTVDGIRVLGTRFDPASLLGATGQIGLGAVFEELLFRSLLLSGLAIVLGGRKWIAILVSAAVFGLVHLANPGADLVTAFGNALGGIIYGMAFLGGRNIWLPLGLHFSWNFSQGPLLGFPVSGYDFGGLLVQQVTGADWVTGGAYGPEGGAVGMVFRFVIMAMVLRYLRRRAGGRGSAASLEFPIESYANPARA